MSKILIINGNPKPDSLCRSFADAYYQGVLGTGSNAKIVHLSGLEFESNLENGYAQMQALGNDLEQLQKNIRAADHIVILTPVWWGTMPAKLKGLFDRILLPGFAYKYEQGKRIPKKLLQGKTSRVIVTMDAPIWYYRWVQGDPIGKIIKNNILEFCGVKVNQIARYGPIISSTEEQREKWLRQINLAGQSDGIQLSGATAKKNCCKGLPA